ncbi:phosphoglycolate phosphatase [Dokdonella sp.]|uniref:phosphoglycolate phosphatase n=1 Tax=Dokdonella sp. TaxID=2291710 RepID=UPI001B28D2AC|nr:phosphoglycolate phosphatase [Dokdonella sp.]MBO9661524.1 phosphoglycolate phosphatase [Dokdonella sp.]
MAAILCDLDGTLLDTVPDIAEAVNAVLLELGRAPLEERVVAGYVGQGVDVLLHRALGGGFDAQVEPGLHARARRAFAAAYAATNGRRTRFYPGVVEGLDAFRALGLRLACVTNKPQAPTDALLAQFGLDRYFEFALGGDVLPQRKPQPEPLLHAAQRLGVAADACLMLGDSANDARAARAAGMPVVLVDYGYTEGRPIGDIDCDAVISSFAELSASLRASRAG